MADSGRKSAELFKTHLFFLNQRKNDQAAVPQSRGKFKLEDSRVWGGWVG